MDFLQINRDNAHVQNIGEQNNYYGKIEGTAFVPLWNCKEEKHYESIKESLYYPPEYLDKMTLVLKAERSILIQGEQGSGKSVLSFKIAELMKSQGLVTSAYYLNPPGDWNSVKQWIQAVHVQEKISGSNNTHLWIIDNLHKMTDGIEDFPDVSAWGSDYCICCTRDLNGIPSEEDVFFPMALSRKQIFRRKVDEKTFLQCYNALADNKIGRHESDFLYRYIGGNLALLRYIVTRGNLPRSLSDWKKERFIDFHNIYASYFFSGAVNRNIRENPGDILKMLFLSQIDFSIPFYLQSHACQTVLKDLYFETTNKELEMEHASLAELLAVCICKEYNLDYGNAFRESIYWTLSNLVNCNIKKEERARQINRFFQMLYSYKFVLNENQILHEICSADQRLSDFLEENAGFISCSTWKRIIETAEKNSRPYEICCASAISPRFADTMNQNQDYDFRFLRDRLSEAELDEIEKHLLSHNGDLIKFIVSKGNEVHLMHLLLSVSEKTAVKLIEQMPSEDLVRLISKNNNGLYLFAYFYCRLGDEVKKILVDKLSADDFRDIFINGASINGVTFLLSITEDPLRKSLLCLLTDDLIDRLVENTIENNYSIGMLDMSLREMKRKSVETLEAFEGAIGVNRYKEVLKSQGTIPVLARLMTSSSSEMQKELSGMAQSNPELVKRLIEKTIEKGSSIGTLDLYLREMKKESVETLEAFEGAIGVNGYKELLKSQGTIPVLARLMTSSSSEMQKELSGMAQSNPELVKDLVKKTIDKGERIGKLNICIKALSRANDSFLQIFERLIGTDGYFEMFSKCKADSITILRILACSSLSDSLVDKVYADMDVWNESKDYILEGSCTILKDFNKDLYYAKRRGRNKFFRFFKEMVSSEELLGWIKQGATLEEAILIMRNLPLTMARNLSMAWMENYDQVMEGIRFVEQQCNGRQAMDPQIVNRAIMKFKNFNREFFDSIDREYRMLLSNRDKGP